MKKIYHLKSCSTNVRILKEIGPGPEVELQNIKEQNIDAEMLDFLKEKVGSYEALFSKKAMKFRSMGLNEMNDPDTHADYSYINFSLAADYQLNGEEVFIYGNFNNYLLLYNRSTWTVIVNLNNMESGVYFVTITANDSKSVQRIVVTK